MAKDYGASLKGVAVQGADVPATGASLIAAERQRQVEAEGWAPEHDDTHTHYELAKAGAAYALYGGFGKMSVDIRDLVWPWEPESFKPSRDRVRDLAKAGALIAAEIDRLLRLSPSTCGPPEHAEPETAELSPNPRDAA